MVVLLALLAAGYTFTIRSNVAASYATHHEFQARMAAEAGIHRAIVELRKSRSNPDLWYDNPQLFRQAAVQVVKGAETFQSYARGAEAAASIDAAREQADPVWRFSLYALNADDPENPVLRYGVSPESGKLDLNAATEEELRILIEAVVPAETPDSQAIDHESLVQCLLDWREGGTQPRPKGAKDEYYLTLRPPYRAKKARFDTVEELLLVRGFTGWVVFGEDYNRNGLLDPNEDDGDASFPPDNADGKLARGLAAYVTVFSREINVDSTNRPRINLNMKDTAKLEEELQNAQLDSKIIDYIMRIRGSGIAFRSVMDLFDVPPEEESDEEEEQTTQPSDDDGAEDEGDSGPPTSQPGDEGSTSQPSDGSTSRQSTSKPSRREPTSKPSSKEPPLANLTDEIPPGTYADLPLILDRLTADPLPMFVGRININTAPREVLSTLPGLTAQEVESIVSGRSGLSGDDRKTVAWVLTEGLISERKFRKLLPRITTGSATFSVESVGFADHVGATKRLSAVVEMRGPIGQILYYRDLTSLGPAYTPYGEETRGFANRSGR